MNASRSIKDMELGEPVVCSKHHAAVPLSHRMKRDRTRICDACHSLSHAELNARARARARALRPAHDDGSGVPGEEWRAIPGYPGYEASNLGRIRSTNTTDSRGRLQIPRVRKQHTQKDGYMTLPLSVNGKRTTSLRVHGLVAAAFHGPKPDGMVVAHWDGVRGNNAATNLRYTTYSENELDKHRHGTKVRGIKLCAETVRQARCDMDKGMSAYAAAKKYGVSGCTMDRIRHRLIWVNV